MKNEVDKIPKDDTSVIVADKKSVTKHLKELDKTFESIRKSFFTIGFHLYWFDDTGAYQQIDNKTYDNIADFAKDRYGISKATTYQYLAVIKKFGKLNPETGEIDAIKDEYADYKSTALIAMTGMSDEQLSRCTPDMKVKELKAIQEGASFDNDNQQDGEEKGTVSPSPSFQNSLKKSNTQFLFRIENITDFENRSKDIMDTIKKILTQHNSIPYVIDISMTWKTPKR